VDPESEADVFAAELLMPDFLARRRCEVSPVSLEPVRALARDFGKSLCASAIRFVELTSERCAAVYSEHGKVSWAVVQPHLHSADRARRAAGSFIGGVRLLPQGRPR
jgi:hypothetical protein